MNYDFIAIDFETANEKRMSVCCAALIFFKNGVIIDEKEWLIKPPAICNYFNDLNIQIHGITPEQVKTAPEFDTIWEEFYSYIDGEMLIAHNAPFDMGVLTNLIHHYNLTSPSLNFVCTCNIARKTWDKQVNYTLKNIANQLGYLFNHHDAHDDAKTCGKILLEALKVHGVNSIDELAQKIDMRIGKLSPSIGYISCSISKEAIKVLVVKMMMFVLKILLQPLQHLMKTTLYLKKRLSLQAL
ncbi:MAG: 3'-5' exonuclease [Niameybacter sp.]|uniref:3'-5' exonuclease n=1 Tax=Niameybacter sp. TaxID=2033640 RepID=UPI002FCC1E78